ncbi:MAG TPA: M61 family peptidase [Thiolapillus brandeum]|uniref:M61 family peptidase n=1 Tax=Thiolapillus brandeum TaxID=1076588 RepID=A0A831KC77_9GAMM|nr:M61 family peptidase [Thiolapillus brandeum]
MHPLIEYTISPYSPQAHLFHVTLIIRRPHPKGQRLSLPAWIPGSYMIRDFAKNIVSVNASCEGESVMLDKLDKQTWQAEPASGALIVNYEVYAWDLSVRGAHLDSTHGFFNGTSVYLQVIGQEKTPALVNIESPADERYQSWNLATSLLPTQVDRRGFGSYQADSYSQLIDCPVEMGDFQQLEFEVDTTPHRMVVSGKCRFDAERLSADLQKICSYHAALFGELPIKSYLFLTFVVGDGYGGLEHKDSTALICCRDDLPSKDMQEVTEGYRKFLGLCSHEYFHLWNVKRIRPDELKKADLSSEVHTELLWAFEGITSYYDDLALVRTRCIEPKSFLDLMAQTITRVMRSPGRFKQSVAESSFDAWTKFYKQDENAPNAIVSYYSKGALVAFGLDMLLRDATQEHRTLDDLMRRLWEEFGKPDIGVPERAIERLAGEIAESDISAFFAQAVHGTQDLPLEQWFNSVGVGYRLRPAKNPEDCGGALERPTDIITKPALGAHYRQQGDFVELIQVFDGGAAQQVGLSAGDKLIAIDGLQVTAKNMEGLIGQFEPGMEVPVHAFRRDELMVFPLIIQMAPMDTCELWLLADDRCTPQQLARRHSWLN